MYPVKSTAAFQAALRVAKNRMQEKVRIREGWIRYKAIMKQRGTILADRGGHECPYPYFDWRSDIGKLEKKKFDNCSVGPGPWCVGCIHFKRHKTQDSFNRKRWEMKKKHRLRQIKITNKPPWKWRTRI